VLPWAIAALAITAAAAAGWIGWRATRIDDRPLLRFVAELGPGAVPSANYLPFAVSADGTRIVYLVRTSAGNQLATRLMDQSKETLLPGTEEAISPFFSPDGQWIGFFTGDKLKKVPVQGGAALTVCDNVVPSGARGGSWGEDGTIVATLDVYHLFRVPEGGGKPQKLLVKADDKNEVSYRRFCRVAKPCWSRSGRLEPLTMRR
jgi:serine/threonine-protein kinase